ncbi:MAG: ABC transporter permease [Clostridiales bacterium]|nr:ABC transporter permease [Clostridiales bacterium]
MTRRSEKENTSVGTEAIKSPLDRSALESDRRPASTWVTSLMFLLSSVLVFLPSLILTVQYAQHGTYSYLTLLTKNTFTLKTRSHNVALDFSSSRIFLILTIVLPILGLVVSLLSPMLKKRFGSKTPAAANGLLALFSLASSIIAQSGLISDAERSAANMNSQSLYFSQNILGNILFVALMIAFIASLCEMLGLRAHLKALAYPYFGWLLVFTILPLGLIFFRAFFSKAGGSYHFTLDGFKILTVNRTVSARFYGRILHLQEYFSVFLRSVDYAVWTTIGCLLVGYPLAFILAKRTKRKHLNSSMLLFFFVLPMWINTMLRTYAWRAFFSQNGVLNNFLMTIGVISDPVLFLKNDIIADIIVKLVLINDFLPFMLLPIYSVLVKLDDNVEQAARDLGANGFQAFWKVLFPLSMPGVISGIQMVFMPALTFYMIPDIMSEGSVTTIGNTVQSFILNESPAYQQAGNVLSLLLLVFVLITMGLLRNQDKDFGGNGGMVL